MPERLNGPVLKTVEGVSLTWVRIPLPPQNMKIVNKGNKIIYHKELASGRWFEIPFMEQMANVGSEVERTISWREKNKEYSQKAFERALELLDLTIADKKNKKRLKELLRVREALADYFFFDNEYGSSDKLWQKYFFSFTWAVRKDR
jgi:hypothetical protein